MTQLDNNNLCIIEYTTTDGEMLSFLEYAFDAEIVAHTYTEVGQIIFDKPISIIGYSAFRECENLASIAIPDSVTDIGEFAFYRCTGLKSITIGENISAIGANAFAGFEGITEIEIPENVTEIADNAFGDVNFTVCGYASSAAEAFATKHSKEFFLKNFLQY